jgi:uncharacterized protein YyaL (SSP411 family)
VDDSALIDRARRTLERYGPQIGRAVRVMPLMVANVARWHAAGTQIVITGAAGEATAALERVVSRRYLPWAIVIPVRSADVSARLGSRLPWIAAMRPRADASTAYLCSGFTCQAPESDPDGFDRQLAQAAEPRRIRTA